MPDKSILDARLAEIDRRLRTIQSGLEPAAQAAQAEREAAAPVVAPEAAPVPKRVSAEDGHLGDLVARLMALVEAHERLLACARELTDRREPAATAPSLGVSAGPFASTEAVRDFARALQALPGVSSAAVREYEGADRAVIDVHLSQPTP
jgi:hypothetical protein